MGERKRLLAWLEKQKMPQAELARQLGFSEIYVWKISSGDKPITDAFKWRFAQTFGFDVAEQLFGENNGDSEREPQKETV